MPQVNQVLMAYKYSNLAELLYASYSGLQMMAFAFQKGWAKYNRECYAFRETIIKKHYLKLVNQYAVDHALLDRSLEDLAALDLPFDFRLLPRTYPQPADASFEHAITTCPLKPLEPVERKESHDVYCDDTIRS